MIEIDTHFGHWRGTLRLAAELAARTSRVEETHLGIHSSSIILSRTSLETYLNEGWFSLKGKTSGEPEYKRFVGLTVVERFSRFLTLTGIAKSQWVKELTTNISIVNQIRNFCIHYTGPNIKQITIGEISKRPALKARLDEIGDTPQSFLVNQYSSKFCLLSVAEAIAFVETSRSPGTPMSDEYAAFCQEILGE
jgi:hypothetical protein